MLFRPWSKVVCIPCPAPLPWSTQRSAFASTPSPRGSSTLRCTNSKLMISSLTLHPNGRIGEIKEVVDAFLFLTDATFTSGEVVPVDGGAHAGKPLASQGFSAFATPCSFNEDQFLFNLDYVASQKSRIAARFFLADSSQRVTFPGNGLNPAGNTPGFTSPGNSDFRVLSLAHTYFLSNTSYLIQFKRLVTFSSTQHLALVTIW